MRLEKPTACGLLCVVSVALQCLGNIAVTGMFAVARTNYEPSQLATLLATRLCTTATEISKQLANQMMSNLDCDNSLTISTILK